MDIGKLEDIWSKLNSLFMLKEVKLVLPEDIINELGKDFVDYSEFLNIKQKLEVFYNTFEDSSRIIRCILYLAKGDYHNIQYLIEVAMNDWRDLIFQAEYDSGWNHIRDFNQPFRINKTDDDNH